MDVGVLEQQRGLPVAAIGNQGRVGLDLLQDAFFFKDFFDPQHFLDLVADGGLAFKLQTDVLAQLHAAKHAVRHDIGLM